MTLFSKDRHSLAILAMNCTDDKWHLQRAVCSNIVGPGIDENNEEI